MLTQESRLKRTFRSHWLDLNQIYTRAINTILFVITYTNVFIVVCGEGSLKTGNRWRFIKQKARLI